MQIKLLPNALGQLLQLVTLFAWTEAEFLGYTEGSPIRRIGHERWQRNIAVAMGNALAADSSAEIKKTMKNVLESVRAQASPRLAEHIEWALQQARD